MNKFKSDLLKLVEVETETGIMFFSDVYVVCCYNAFLDLPIQATGIKDTI